MKDMDEIKKKNEEIAREFGKIESALPSFSNGKDLFEIILIQMEGQFHIPFVWISIINRHDLRGLIQELATSKIIKDRLNIIDEAAFCSLVADGEKPILVNDDLKPYFKLFPKKRKFFIRSLAIAPITLHKEIIGSLNHGDFSSLRYHPDMDTTLLQRLASHISIRLSEMIPCEKKDNSAKGETGNVD